MLSTIVALALSMLWNAKANPNNTVYNLRSSEKWNQIEHNQKRINANQFSLANDKW